MIGGLLLQLTGCSSCVEDKKREEAPATSSQGAPIGTRTAKITDKRPGHAVPIDDATPAGDAAR